MQIIEMAKEHPAPFAIGAVVILLIIVASRGSSAAPSAAGYSTAAMQNSTALAQINAATAVSLGAQATERYNAGETAALQRTGIAAGLVNTMVNSGASVSTSMAGINATMIKNSQDAANARAAMNDNLQLQQANINAQTGVAYKNLDAQIQMHTDDNNFKIAQIGAQTQGNLALMDKAGLISTTQLGMNLDAQGTSLPMILQSQENMARITGQNAIQIAQVNTKAADTAAQAAKNKSDWGIIADIGSWFGL